MRQNNFMLTRPKASNTNLVASHLRACCKHTQEGDGKKKSLSASTSLFSQGAKTAWAIYLAPEIAHPAPQAVPRP